MLKLNTGNLPDGLGGVPENGLAPAEQRVEREVGLAADEMRRRLPDHSVREQRRHLHRQRRTDAAKMTNTFNGPAGFQSLE